MARAGTRTCPATPSRRWAHSLHPPMPAARRRHPCSPICTRPTTRCPTAWKAYLDGLTARHQWRARIAAQYANLRDQGQESTLCRPPDRAHPPGDRARRASSQQGLHPPTVNGIPRDESDGVLSLPVRAHGPNHCSSAASAGARRTRSRSGTIGCVQHHAMWDYWPHTRSGNRVTVKGDRPV